MNFVAIKTPEQNDLLSLHRVRSRLVRQRTAIINQIRCSVPGIGPIISSAVVATIGTGSASKQGLCSHSRRL
jgi:hypothetical protein